MESGGHKFCAEDSYPISFGHKYLNFTASQGKKTAAQVNGQLFLRFIQRVWFVLAPSSVSELLKSIYASSC